MNFEQIKNRLEVDLGLSISDIGHHDIPKNDEQIGEWEEVFSKGGEGEGENWETVIHFKKHNVYISISAFYQSYDGTDFSDSELIEVFPVERTVTFYE